MSSYAIRVAKVLYIVNLSLRMICVTRTENQSQSSLTTIEKSIVFHNWRALGWISLHLFSLHTSALLFWLSVFIIRLASFLVLSNMLGNGHCHSQPGEKDTSHILQTKVLSFTVIAPLMNNDRGQDYPDWPSAIRADPKTKVWGQYHPKYTDARQWVTFSKGNLGMGRKGNKCWVGTNLHFIV